MVWKITWGAEQISFMTLLFRKFPPAQKGLPGYFWPSHVLLATSHRPWGRRVGHDLVTKLRMWMYRFCGDIWTCHFLVKGQDFVNIISVDPLDRDKWALCGPGTLSSLWRSRGCLRPHTQDPGPCSLALSCRQHLHPGFLCELCS